MSVLFDGSCLADHCTCAWLRLNIPVSRTKGHDKEAIQIILSGEIVKFLSNTHLEIICFKTKVNRNF